MDTHSLADNWRNLEQKKKKKGAMAFPIRENSRSQGTEAMKEVV